MRGLEPGTSLQANAADLEHSPVEDWQHVMGEPSTASMFLGNAFGAEFGLWEMTSGAMRDEEADEVFIVISGTATLEFLTPGNPMMHLESGSIVRLTEGMATRWTVTSAEPLRKLYIVGQSDSNPESDK